MHGEGRYDFVGAGGGHYSGTFEDGDKQGKGREVYEDSSFYEGDFAAGQVRHIVDNY
jgi:hypothetical protein